MKERYFNVGKIVNTHGIRGEVRVISVTDFENERFEPGSRLIYFKEKNSDPVELIVNSHRKHKQFDLLTFKGHDSLNDVEQYKGGLLKVAESDMSKLDEGEYYYYEIIGSEVYLTDGQYVGQITEILSPGANDVWVVKRNGQKDALIPYIEDVVKNVDVNNKKVLINNVEGLLD